MTMDKATVKTFAATTWDEDHLTLHVVLPYNQVQPPQGEIAWGAARCGRAMRINGSHENAVEVCEECWR